MTTRGSLGEQLGRLVHSVQAGDASLAPMAEQVLATWRQPPGRALRLEPTLLRGDADGSPEAPLDGHSPEGHWILPTFLAGLRQIRPQPTATAADLIRLVEQLAEVGPRAEAIDRLRDWLWMDGAEGFDVALVESVTETLDGDLVDRAAAGAKVREVRALAAGALARASAGAPGDLAGDLAGDLEGALDGPLREMTGAIRRGHFEVDPDTEAELRALFRDHPFWARAQLDFALARPGMAIAADPEVVEEILAKVDHDVDLELVLLLADVVQHEDPFSRALATQLGRRSLGERLAAGVQLTGETIEGMVECLAELLAGDRTILTEGLAAGLLARAAVEEDLRGAMPDYLAEIGLEEFWKHLDVADLPRGSAGALAEILGRCAPTEAITRDLLTRGGGADPIVEALPPEAFLSFPAELRAFLERVPVDESGELVEGLARTGDAPTVAALGAWLRESRGEGWHRRTLEAVTAALVQAGLGRELVVPLARDRDADVHVRLVAYQATTEDPELLDLVLHRAGPELREPPAVKKWLHEARARRRARGDG